MPVANQSNYVPVDMDNLPESNLKRYPGPKGIPIEQIIDLRSRGLSISQIGKLLGCDSKNVWVRLQKSGYDLDNTKYYRQNRAEILAYEQNRIRQHFTDAKLQKSSLRDLVVAYGILYDKERLESGLSTANVSYSDAIKARKQLLKERQALDDETLDQADEERP